MNNIHKKNKNSHTANSPQKWQEQIKQDLTDMTKLCEPYLAAMKTYTGRRGIAPLILNYGKRVRCALFINPEHFTPGRRGPTIY
jgi:hypothetical protein